MNRFRPTKGNVFVAPEETGPTAERIIVPDNAKNRDMPHIGKVIAMGGARVTKKGIVLEPEFQIGDRVVFKKFTGLWTDVRNQRWILVKAHDVEGVFNEL